MKTPIRAAWTLLAFIAAVVLPLRVAEIYQAHEANQIRSLTATSSANR